MKGLRLSFFVICFGIISFGPTTALAQTRAQLDTISELKAELERWKDQGRNDDILIIEQNSDALIAQVKAGKLDLQSIVDAHKGEGKTDEQPSSVVQASSPQNALPLSTAKVKAENRPVRAVSRVERTFKGFPAILTTTVHMHLVFPNGNVVNCSDWDPTRYDPTPESVGQLDKCSVSRDAGDGNKINAFEKGERPALRFGNVSATNYDLGGGDSSTLSGGSLLMTKDGRIAIGSYRTFSVSNDAAFGAGGRNEEPIEGRYELDDYIIKITTDEGKVFHSFIGWVSNSGDSSIDHIYFNGQHYWDRSK